MPGRRRLAELSQGSVLQRRSDLHQSAHRSLDVPKVLMQTRCLSAAPVPMVREHGWDATGVRAPSSGCGSWCAQLARKEPNAADVPFLTDAGLSEAHLSLSALSSVPQSHPEERCAGLDSPSLLIR